MKFCEKCSLKTEKLPKGCKNNGICKNTGCNKLTVFDWLSNINQLNRNNNYLVEVRFKNDRKNIYKISNDISNIQIGNIVVVESSLGYDIGIVSLVGNLVFIQIRKKKIIENEIKKVYRIANKKDIDIWKYFKEQEYTILLQSRKIARNLNLIMKISDVEYQGDGSKITFYYTSNTRIDFRELIKKLAKSFRCKIDMRQIGYRQESAKIGGIGSCGRELCCSSWLTNFRSVNTMAARYQQLSINPQKLAGQCGKLKCCLNFELDSYLDAMNDFPPNNTILLTQKGQAICLKIDVFRKKMWFMYKKKSISWYVFDVKEVKKFIKINEKGVLLDSLEELKKKEIKIKQVDIIQENNLNRFEIKESNSKKIVFNNIKNDHTKNYIKSSESLRINHQKHNIGNNKNNV